MNLKMKVMKLLVFVLTIACMMGGVEGAYGAPSPQRPSTPKVILIVVNRVGFEDLYTMPNVKKMIDNGYIALMNTRGSGSNNEFKSYATLGWGVRSEATHNTSLFYNLDEEVHPIYVRRTGNDRVERGVVNLHINRLIQQNSRGEYGAVPGELGQTLRENGLKTAVLGNSDTDDVQLRSIGLIAMDYNGYIDYGDVSSKLIEESEESPFGIRTNYEQLLIELKDIYPHVDFLAIESGDTTRLERYRENLNESTYEKHKKDILHQIDQFIGKLLEEVNEENTRILITAAYPSDLAAARGERLTPVVAYHFGQKGGLLGSSTTRRQGIIGNVDIGPTILSYFGLQSDNMTGRVVQEVEWEDHYQHINELNSRVVNTSQQRYRVLYSFAVYEMIASALALLVIVFRKRLNKGWLKAMSLLLLGTVVVPFTLLILPILGRVSLTMTYILLICISAAIVMVVYFLGGKNPLDILIFSSLLLVGGLLIDIVSGQNLIKNSLLGYDPIIGARYYGIGNEYMGILIGAILILTTALKDRYKINTYMMMAFYIVSVVIIGYPQLGANVGGTITAVFAFLFTSIRLLGKKINFKKLVYIGMAVFAVVALMAIVDLYLMESKSHLAGAIEQIASNGPLVIYQIIVRKISMNIRIMGVTVWSRVLLSAMVTLGILFYKPVGILKKISTLYPGMAIGWTGILVACMIGFAVNDSGVVAAATSIIFLTTSILFLTIHLFYEKSQG